MKLRLCIILVCVLLRPVGPGNAQTTAAGSALAVDHAVPFGTVPGKLLLLGDYLVFVDEQQPGASFVIARGAMETLISEGTSITVQTKEPIRNRSGEVRRLSFRVVSPGDLAVATQWYGGGVALLSSAAPAAMPAADTSTYQARHNHRFGECRGRLIFGRDLVSYESVSAVGHSRRWEYQAIKETKLSNPYELEIKPFSGDTYNLHFDGTGMDPAAYQELVSRVTAARATR